VDQVRRSANRVVAKASAEIQRLLPGASVVHIGATSLPDGLTKGDVDVNVRVPADRFDEAVRELSSRYERAQIQNWTPTYASFADGAEELLLGIQVTVVGAPDDFLIELHGRLVSDPALRAAYNELKQEQAPHGHAAYWLAKNDFLRRVVASL
jgi:GrpB-like predicted nucleotidyltransferase (UPF0157 family)